MLFKLPISILLQELTTPKFLVTIFVELAYQYSTEIVLKN